MIVGDDLPSWIPTSALEALLEKVAAGQIVFATRMRGRVEVNLVEVANLAPQLAAVLVREPPPFPTRPVLVLDAATGFIGVLDTLAKSGPKAPAS